MLNVSTQEKLHNETNTSKKPNKGEMRQIIKLLKLQKYVNRIQV